MDVAVQLKRSVIHLEPLCRPVMDAVAKFPFAKPEHGGKFSLPIDRVIYAAFKEQMAATGVGIQGTVEIPPREVIKDPVVWANNLFPYQVEGANYLRSVGRCILADEMGLGKTRTVIEAITNKRSLIVAPLYKCEDWAKEIEERHGEGSVIRAFSPHKFDNDKKVKITMGTRHVVTNYEQLTTEKKANFLAAYWDVIVLEEAHFLQNRNSSRTKAVAKLCSAKPVNVWMLTGTPVWNEPDTIWSLLNILDPIRFSSYWRFVEAFCNIRDNKFGREIIGSKPENLPIFRQIVAEYMLRRLTRDMLNLPSREEYEIRLESSKALLKEIREWKRNAKDEEGYINQAQLRYLILEKGNKKEELIKTLQKEKGKKVLIFVKYRASAALVLDWLKNDCRDLLNYIPNVPITGDLAVVEREQIIDEFKTHEGGGALIGTARCMGTGLDLQFASVVIFVEHPSLYSELQQCCGRIERIGTTETPTYYYFIQEKTVDERLWRTCMARSSSSSGILN